MPTIRRRSERGQSLVEFALVLMPLFVILLAIIQFGFIFNAYVTITNATREGARNGTVYVYDAAGSKAQNDLARNDFIKTSLLASMNLLAKTSPNFATGSTWTQSGDTFTNGDLVVTYVLPSGTLDTDARVGQQITVRATYHQDLVIPIIPQFLPKRHERSARADVRSDDGRELMAMARRDDGRARRRGRRPAQGQILVLFAMALVGIMAAAGLAFDLGRFYSEKRFLQNAADAGALAVANALIRGESTTDAEAEGRDVLARNLLSSPTGTVASVALTPQYEAGHSGDPSYLSSGILISGGDVRVAIRSDVSYTFGRVVGLNSTVVGGRALVKTKGDLLPVAVRHYINAPGPFGGPSRRATGTPTTSRTSSRRRTPRVSGARPTPRSARPRTRDRRSMPRRRTTTP